MFDFFFGWRKASKCKKLIKRVQCRLMLLKNKRNSIVKQLREDVAQLLKLGYQDLAFKRAEHLFNDQTTLAVYEFLENFCHFIILNLSYIRRNKDCPNDINEAVSSLIFASARCGDLPELRAIRKLFSERYGQKFELVALEILPGNLVNLQLQEKLSNKSVPDDVKQKLVDDIAKDYCLKPKILAIDYTTEKHIVESCQVETANAASMVEQSSSVVIDSPNNCSEAKEIPDSKEVQKITGSSSESLPQFSEEMIVYLDDIEEVKHSVSQEGSCQDQRTFKFKPSLLPDTEKGEEFYDVKYDSWSDRLSSRSRKRVKVSRKRTKRRSMSRENLSVKDIECVSYYKPSKKSSSNKHHRKNPVPICCCFNLEGENCCLKHPCYFNTSIGRHYPPFLAQKQKDAITHGLESDTEMECEFRDIVSNDSSPTTATRKIPKAPYLRAMTMPQERSKTNHPDNVLRSSSFPVRSPNHVHPKLPDYDEIAAKFKALKNEHQQNKFQNSRMGFCIS